MFFKKKDEQQDLEEFRDITDDVEEDEFVPYASLFAEDTILSKNGELLKTIKIAGFSNESVGDHNYSLRDIIRRAIVEHTSSDAFAFWFHTMRRRTDLSIKGNYPDAFSQKLDAVWNEKNRFDKSYVNELYITIVRRCENPEIRSPAQFFEGLLPSKHHKSRFAFLDNAKRELDQVSAAILQATQNYGARLLSTVEREGIFYSEQLEFMEKLINLEERPMPVPLEDLSTYLTSGEITFAFNAMEVRTFDGHRRFSTVLTVKDYKEASLTGIDHFMQIPCEFIVTQSFDFINGEGVRAEFEDQTRFARLSGDKEFAEITELDRITAANRGHTTDYGQQQTTIFVIAESVRDLEWSVKFIRSELQKTGIISIREDLKFEECYWSQIPANFAFVNRQTPIDTPHVGGFANLSNQPMGNRSGSKWGAPAALFRTAAGTPYFFNFHNGEQGHTMVVGPRGAGKSVLTNFILSQARKMPYRLIYCDAQATAKPFVEALGGQHITADALKLNPFSLPDSKSNREFLGLWIVMLAAASGINVEEKLFVYFSKLVDYMYQLPEEQRHLETLIGAIKQQDASLAEKFSPWVGNGKYAHLYTKGKDSLCDAIAAGSVRGIDISRYMHDPVTRLPVSSYVLQRITKSLDGEPTILMLDEAWWVLDNPIFGPRLAGWLAHVQSKNALVLMATENIEDAATRSITPAMLEASVTHFFMPDAYPTEYYKTVFKLTPKAYQLLGGMVKHHRQFLMRRQGEEIVATMDLAGHRDILDVLSGIEPAKPAMQTTEIMQQPSAALWEEPA